MLSNSRTLPTIAIALPLIVSGIITPIISDIRENHKALKSAFTEQIAEVRADLEIIRKEIYRDFVTSKNHQTDIDLLLNQVNRLEERLYEIKR